MRRSAVIAIGFCLGLIIAGAVNAALVTLLPDGFRSASVVWGATAFVTAVSMTACWVFLAYRRP
jgi:hypothetical protein